MSSMLNPLQNIVPGVNPGLSDARPASVQGMSMQQPAATPTPQLGSMNPSAQMIAGAPNRMAMDPMLLQQILSTMLLQPQQSIGAMMQPQQGQTAMPSPMAQPQMPAMAAPAPLQALGGIV